MGKWPDYPLLELARLARGTEPGSVSYTDASRGIRFLRVGDVTGKRDNPVFTESSQVVLVGEADLLLTLDGSPGHVSCGHEGAISSGIRKVAPADGSRLTRAWLKYSLMSPAVQETIRRHTTGVTIAHASAAVPHIRIPLPPLPEQERIVQILDEAEALCRLGSQADERTADLIATLFTTMFGDPTTLEQMSQPRKAIGDFAAVSYGLADKLDAATQADSGVRILTISNVTLKGSLDLSVKRYSTAPPREQAKARLQKWDLLFNWRNGSEEHVGKTAIWEEQIPGDVLHVSFLLKLRVDPTKAHPLFLWVLLNRLRATGFFKRNARMQINTKFNASELSALQLPLPPLELQHTFTAHVVAIRELEAVQTVSRKRLADLFQSVLHRAFQREL